MLELADNDLLVADRETGLNDYNMNRRFADRLDALSKTFVSFSKRCSETANTIRDKVDAAEDNKAGIQDIVYLETVTDPAKQCEKLQLRTRKPKRWNRHIKTEDYGVFYVSSDEEEEITDADGNKVKHDKTVYSGNLDTKFTYGKKNNNEATKHRCMDCEQNFRDSIELRNHQAHHTTELYRCMKCLQMCRTKRSFANHMATHLNIRYRCGHPDCGMEFNLKTTLTNHLQKHSTTRLKCDRCKRTFQYRQSQLEHIKYRHRKNKSVQCPVCKKMYWTPTSMRSHRAKYHYLASELYREG